MISTIGVAIGSGMYQITVAGLLFAVLVASVLRFATRCTRRYLVFVRQLVLVVAPLKVRSAAHPLMQRTSDPKSVRFHCTHLATLSRPGVATHAVGDGGIMPKFFFHLWDTRVFVPDPNGSDLPDLATVRQEAIATAQQILVDGRSRGEDRSGWVLQVQDEQDRTILKLPLAQAAS